MKIPYANFKTRINDNEAVGGCTFIGGEWTDIDTTEIFDNKRIVVFALPGAFTPTCSSQQLPGYEEKYGQLKAYGIDEVYCLSVNDAFVMNAWFKDTNVKKGDELAYFRMGSTVILIFKDSYKIDLDSLKENKLVKFGNKLVSLKNI